MNINDSVYIYTTLDGFMTVSNIKAILHDAFFCCNLQRISDRESCYLYNSRYVSMVRILLADTLFT
jgi:hypothetical protein